MKAQIKVEIITNRLERREVVRLLDRFEIKGYTFVDNAKGRGNRGEQDGAGLTGSFTNAYFIIICEREDFQRIKEPMRELLTEIGGVCFVSEGEWLMH
ncbi:MAG: hypothetical protein AAGI38_04485 [Bacteroidota bacterium]